MSTRPEYENTEKQVHSIQIERQSNINRNTIHPNTEQTLTQEEKINTNTIKRMMFEKKTILSLRNQDWKTIKVETEK